MITSYFLIAFFVMGIFIGSIYQEGEQVPAKDWAVLFLLALIWPFVVYLYLKDLESAE